ncbi:MAG: hypothetical protein M3075_06775 [Candidatus Dormibacteraeota bacterium]|jgi:hypothetical protein|nr:hypothetical protein [Candidatus Dormibacteraeota bacterium]
MTDYIAYLEAQKKMIEQFDTRTTRFAPDTDSESAATRPHVAQAPLRHGLADALRAAASRLDRVAA